MDRMKAIVTVGTGGFDKLEVRDVPIPVAGPDDVLIKVLAAGVNNTDVNTRVGWYSASVSDAMNDVAADEGATTDSIDRSDGGWNQATPFPLIQGTDCCGRIVQAGSPDLISRVGERVIIRACMRTHGFDSLDNVWMGSDFDGAFAQFVRVSASEAFAVESSWSDVELGSIPCAYATAENLIHRARVADGEHVLVTGASGGVGSAAVQLVKRRGARVTAICGVSKADRVRAIGADAIIPRGVDPAVVLQPQSIDAVIDIVGGPSFPGVLDLLRRGGRYATSGAIGGPTVVVDLRTLYLRDITMYGATAWDEPVFPNLISYIERDEIRPVIAKTFSLDNIVAAQRKLLERRHVGKLVLIPPAA